MVYALPPRRSGYYKQLNGKMMGVKSQIAVITILLQRCDVGTDYSSLDFIAVGPL
jgi:hypothetical protein